MGSWFLPAIVSISYKNPCEPKQGVPVGDAFPKQTSDETQQLAPLPEGVQHPPGAGREETGHSAPRNQLQVWSRPAKSPSSRRLFLLRFPSSTASPSPQAKLISTSHFWLKFGGFFYILTLALLPPPTEYARNKEKPLQVAATSLCGPTLCPKTPTVVGKAGALVPLHLPPVPWDTCERGVNALFVW